MSDPLVVNTVPENDNQLIRRVMTVLKIGLAQQFGCALVVAHHDVKSGGDDEDSDQSNARGAGDLVNAVRFELAVKKMSLNLAGDMNIPAAKRGWHFRVGSAASKMNYFEPQDAEWMQRLSLPIGIGGQQTVYCTPWDPPPDVLDEEQNAALIREIAAGSKFGPYSPQLGRHNDRSLALVLKSLGIVTREAQRRVLRRLRDSDEVVVAKFKRPGHGSNIRAGLRTAAGEPRNYEWQDEAETDGEGAAC